MRNMVARPSGGKSRLKPLLLLQEGVPLGGRRPLAKPPIKCMKNYLEEARDFLREAESEYERGEREGNIILMRDACEKAWGGVIQALNAFFISKDVSPLPRSHRDRRLKLRELEWKDEAIREKALLDRFMARAHVLHERAFYDGDIVPSEVKDEFEKAKAFIEDVEELISQRREERCLDT